jgi:hypothetical protein
VDINMHKFAYPARKGIEYLQDRFKVRRGVITIIIIILSSSSSSSSSGAAASP